jgi:C4-dicarboxylate-specific signal transduction histidine kinase
MVAIALGILTTRWIVGLILQLRNASQAIAQGDLNQSVEISGINELEDLSQVFNQMAGQLKTSFENKEQLVQERTKELSQALTDLQTTQQELVQSEKMAALGQLVAGIAHEINTPLGAIRASISNITSGLESALAQLPQVLQKLSLPQQTEFNALLNAACQPHPYLSTRETRKLKRTLAQELATYNIENPEALADTLVQMGITENLMQFLPLFQNEHGALVLETANNLSSQFRNSENINLAVDRAAKIIYALKSYARQDTSGSKIMAKITDNIDIVLTLYHNQIKQKIELIQNYQPVPDILCYPEELSQVWTNLIHNAIQAMNYKGVLKINVFQQEQFVVVQIVDSGMGIPLEIQEKIFEPFFTTKPAGEGSGLGLDIVSKIIKKHDGSIEVASQLGETTFSIYLPID